MIKGSGSRNPQVSVRSDISRRSLIKATVGMSAILAAGAAPAFIRNAGAAGRRKISFMLPFLFVGGHAFEFVAQAEGWKVRGLDVDIVRGYGSGAACKAISAGQVDFGEASYGVMVNSISSGIDNVAIGVKLQKLHLHYLSCRFWCHQAEGHGRENLGQFGSLGRYADAASLPRAPELTSRKSTSRTCPSKLVSTVLNNPGPLRRVVLRQHRCRVAAQYGRRTLSYGLRAQHPGPG
jgi:hypothetical protein